MTAAVMYNNKAYSLSCKLMLATSCIQGSALYGGMQNKQISYGLFGNILCYYACIQLKNIFWNQW